jgi:site-specific recombinase XerD
MFTQVRKIRTEYNGYSLDPLWLVLDQHSALVLLPLLYTSHLALSGSVYEIVDWGDDQINVQYKELEVSDSTIRSYVYCLSRFLNFLELAHNNHQTPGLHASNTCTQRFLNYYLNNELASQLNSFHSLELHQSALTAYFNFLASIGVTTPIKLSIHRKTRQAMAKCEKKQHYIQYLSTQSRFELLGRCKNLGEKLMLRMGFEVGLRTSELTGLRAYSENCLTNLFAKLDNQEMSHVNRFRYRLEGRYTKGGRSRWIYFDRDLIQDMKRYFSSERKLLAKHSEVMDQSFFLRTDQRYKGTGIGPEQGSRVFKRRAIEAGLNPILSFHDLRHTFATELFHSELQSSNGRETRSESAALITVSQRLGHSIGKDGYAPAVTTRYIRMRIQMIELEGINENDDTA